MRARPDFEFSATFGVSICLAVAGVLLVLLVACGGAHLTQRLLPGGAPFTPYFIT